jgi:hypothetical protein
MNKVQQMIQKLNVPQEMRNDPHQIVNYLVQSGKIDQSALNSAIQKAQQMGIKL